MRRRRKPPRGLETGMDSFLDIVSNSLGLLILILTFNVLTSGSVELDLGTPLSEDPDPSLQVVHFECAGNSVFRMPDPDRDGEGRHGSYAVQHGAGLGGPTVEITLLSDAKGPTLQQFREDGPGPKLLGLPTLSPDQVWIHFLVRPDGFEVFRAARDAAKRAGFDTGWLPWPAERSIVFSNQGVGIKRG